MTMQITFPRWVLPVSLLLNVFLAGVVAALALPMAFGPPRPPHGPPDPMHMAERMAETLPPADAELLRKAFAARAGMIRDSKATMDAFPDRLRAAMGAEPFAIDTLAAVFADGRAARTEMEDAMSAAVLDAVGRMSPEGRHRLAMWQPGPSHPPRGGRPGDPPR